MRELSSKFYFVLLLFSITNMGVHAQAPRIVINPLGHSAKIHNVVFSPDGHQIISVSEDKTIRIWSAETGEMLKKFESQIGEGPEGMFYASALSPDGKLLAVAGYKVESENENYVVIIDLEKGTQVSTAVGHTDVINSLSFSGSGKYLASGGADNVVKIWRVEPVAKLSVITSITVSSAVSCVVFNRVTQDLAVAHESSEILLFGLAGLDRGITKFTPRILKRHKGTINKLVYTLDGSYLASSSFENELIVWKADGSVIKEFEDLVNPINAIAFSADSKIMVSLDVIGKGTSWGIPAGNKFAEYNGHDNTVFSAAFAPSLKGNYVVASAGGINNEIILWNPINGLAIRKIKGKGNAIQDLSFTSNMELAVAHELTKEKKPLFKASFNLESLTLSRPVETMNGSTKESNNDVSQTGPNTLDLPKGKKILTDENQDGRILDYHALADGNVIVASDFSLKMFDKNGYIHKEFVGHYGAVRTVAVSPDGRYLASGGEDQSIIIWKLSDTGFAPSLRQAFDDEDWAAFFTSLPFDSLTKEPTKKAWLEVIGQLKSSGNKAYKGIEEIYKTLGEQVIPFATLFLTDDLEWICWTPRGYFSCSSAGGQYFGWHINKGIDQLADFYSAEQYFEILYRPTEVSNSFKQGKRVEDILRESGERIFDLSKLHRPSVGFFDITVTTHATDLLKYDQGKYFTQARTVPLTVDIYDGGGGIKEVNIYQNDKLIISDKDVKTSKAGDKRSKTYAVEMANERNEFKVKVVNFQKIESRADELVIEYTGEVIASSTLHILAVGINKYKNAAYNLNYAQPDAYSFVEKLNERSRTIFKSVNRVEIYDEEATKENITTGFKAMIARAKPEDVFMFYYAGHGTLDEENNDEYYLVPTDITKLYGDPQQLHARGISATDLRGFLTQIKSQKQIVLMDACHSGGAVKSLSTRGVATDEKAMVQLARSSGVVMIASSGTKQLATEFEALKHGVFTYALLEALDGKADNGDRKITVNEIKFYMEDRVPELTKQYGGKAQYPTGYITGNDFPISILER
jgi:WD40 repeat protein